MHFRCLISFQTEYFKAGVKGTLCIATVALHICSSACIEFDAGVLPVRAIMKVCRFSFQTLQQLLSLISSSLAQSAHQ